MRALKFAISEAYFVLQDANISGKRTDASIAVMIVFGSGIEARYLVVTSNISAIYCHIERIPSPDTTENQSFDSGRRGSAASPIDFYYFK